MRRPVVAIDTIHAPLLRGFNLFSARPASSIVILGHISIAILHADPWNYLPLLVARDEGDLVAEVHMPVNTRNWSTQRITATDVYQHACLSERVLFVVGVVIESF